MAEEIATDSCKEKSSSETRVVSCDCHHNSRDKRQYEHYEQPEVVERVGVSIHKHTQICYLRSVAIWEPSMNRVSTCSMAQGRRASSGGRHPTNQHSGSKHSAT